MTQRVKIAVTGGIGSGKTAVKELLAQIGYPVFSCDEISRELWEDGAYRSMLAERFPACTEGGEIDKSKLSALVFSDEGARKELESLSHPLIMRELMARMERFLVSFAEVPLLFEGGYEGLFDGVILVKREEERRIASVIARDGLTEEEVKRRISAQLTDAEREKNGVVVIENNGSFEELGEKLRQALRSFGI